MGDWPPFIKSLYSNEGEKAQVGGGLGGKEKVGGLLGKKRVCKGTPKKKGATRSHDQKKKKRVVRANA